MAAPAPLDVLVVPSWYPSREKPIKGVFVREHAQAIARRHRVAVLYVEPDPSRSGIRQALREEAGLLTLRVRVPRRGPAAVQAPAEMAAVAGGLRRLRAAGFRPDVIHAHVFLAGLNALPAARALGVPLVVSEHYSGFPRGLLTPWSRVASRLVFRGADVVAPVSENLRRHLELVAPTARYRVVANLVDTSTFGPPAQPPGREGPARLLLVGGLTPVKGVRHAIRALALLSVEAELWVVGDGPERPVLEQLARELGVAGQVVFHGSRPRGEVAELMRRAHLYVLSSEWENLPCALLEAQVSGLPAVASAVGGVPEAIDVSNGELVPAGEPGTLAAAIERALLEASFDRDAIARRAAARWGADHVVPMWDAVYREALELAQARRRVRMRLASRR